jgi:hypothetical protein
MLEADVIQEQVEAPLNGWCACGHVAAKTFKRGGADTPAEPTRFFLISGKVDREIKGIYCEPCLVIANYLSRLKKQGKI